MLYNLLEIHKAADGSQSPSILLRRHKATEVNHPSYVVGKPLFDEWVSMHRSKKVQQRIFNTFKESIPLTDYLVQNGYNLRVTLIRLRRYDFLTHDSKFPYNSLYGYGEHVYLPVPKNLVTHLTDDEVINPRTMRKITLEEALFLCDSSLSLEEAKERILSMGLSSKVSIKGESWFVPAELPYDL